MRKFFCFTCCVSMGLFFCFPATVPAQSGETANPATHTYLEDVVVTATRTENKVLETAGNISVIKAEDLKAIDAKNVAEALRRLPGVFYSNASGLEPKITLRATRLGMSPGALVLMNGIPLNIGKFSYMDWESVPVENIERIEIVRGPMSSLYGGESSRGVINIITGKGKADFSGEVNAAYGTYDDVRLSALLNGRQGDWDYSLHLKKRSQDGYRDHTEIDNYYLNGKLAYWLSDAARLGFYLNFTDKNRILAKSLTVEERAADRRQPGDLSDTDNADTITGLNFNLKQTGYDFDATLYYKNRDKHYENYYKTASKTPYLETLDEDVLGARTIYTLKQPLMGKANRLSVGFDVDQDSNSLKTRKAAKKKTGLPYTKPDPKKSGDFTRTELGLFVQDEFSALENLTLTLGLRYDYFEFDNDADYDFTENGQYAYDARPSYDKLNPRFSLNYQPVPEMGIFAGFSQSYRAPTVYDYYASGSYSSRNAYTLTPESFTQWEGGVRYAAAKGLNLETTLFHIGIDDMLDSAYDAKGKYMGKQNVSEATSQGLEFSVNGAPCAWFSYNLNYTYTDARYTKDFFAKADKRTVVNINGHRLTKTPYHKFNLDADFRVYQQADYELRWHASLQAQDAFRMDNAGSETYGGYTLVNTKLRLIHPRFEGFVGIDNLFDRTYDNYAYASYGTSYYYPAAGTTWAFGVTWKF